MPSNNDESVEDILTEEIKSWHEFGSALRYPNRNLFFRMLKECCQYRDAISAKGELYSTESFLMTLIFIQQKMIKDIINHKISAAKNNAENNIERIE